MTNKSLPGDLVVWNNCLVLALIIARRVVPHARGGAVEEIIVLEPNCMVERLTFRKGAHLDDNWWTVVAKNQTP